MCTAALCIDCNWAYSGFLDSIVLIVAAIGALLAALSALAEYFEQPIPYHGDRARRTGQAIHDGVVSGGGYGPTAGQTPTPTPTTPTSVPPPPGSAAPGIGEQLWDIVGEDLLNLGKQ